MQPVSSPEGSRHAVAQIYVARQPIFDSRQSLFAYELLFRDGFSNMVPDIDGDIATSTLLLNSFLGIGLGRYRGRSLFCYFISADIRNRLSATTFSPRATDWVTVD